MIKVIFSIAAFNKNKLLNCLIISVIIPFNLKAQLSDSLIKTYIKAFAPEAINQMIEYKIPASITLAQAIFESGGGKSVLAKRGNNHFGIKCHLEWFGDTIRKSDDSLNECFRSYKNARESYADHSHFLTSRPRYKNLFTLSITDYKSWSIGLKNCGYATNPIYHEGLIKLIEKYKLYEYDKTEYLPVYTLIAKDNSLIKSKFSASACTLKEFNKHSALFIDEKQTLIQSLNLIVEKYDYDLEKIADN